MKIVIGKGSCGIAAGAEKTYSLFEESIKLKGLEAELSIAGCIGMCYLEPIVDVIDAEGEKTTFVKITDKTTIDEIIKFAAGEANKAEIYAIKQEDMAVLGRQTRIAMRNCGLINPESLDQYIEAGGYKAIEKCLSMTPEMVIDEIKLSGLAGRGGAGFPTWFKWNAARAAAGEKKYVICNADEGDPGAFMDRAIIEGDPHSLIEGMLISAYAIGSNEGIVYVRAEYPLAIVRLEAAIKSAREKGFLGVELGNSGFRFDLRIKAGAGAFVCGEETALIASLEGERGMPRLKPPFPAQKGFWQRPSNINNVETYANVAWIINNGGKAFAAMGTQISKGTKVFAVTGKTKKGGLVEVPMGMTLKDIIFGIACGIKDDKQFKAVQMGGPSGGCIPSELIETLIDYKSLAQTGAIMGSGGMVVMDETTCMVDMARFFLDFTCKESCGKCIHCRVGTKRMLEILERIIKGDGKDGDIELLSELAVQVKEGSLCGLGQTASNPVLTTLKYFKNEYEDHVYSKKCTAKQCQALIKYEITDKCVGCTVCKRNCPTAAISGEIKKQHEIAQEKCVKCGNCSAVCKFSAVSVN